MQEGLILFEPEGRKNERIVIVPCIWLLREIARNNEKKVYIKKDPFPVSFGVT